MCVCVCVCVFVCESDTNDLTYTIVRVIPLIKERFPFSAKLQKWADPPPPEVQILTKNDPLKGKVYQAVQNEPVPLTSGAAPYTPEVCTTKLLPADLPAPVEGAGVGGRRGSRPTVEEGQEATPTDATDARGTPKETPQPAQRSAVTSPSSGEVKK